MRATFHPLTAAGIDGVLVLMAQLYQHDPIAWDEDRARKATHGLLAASDSGGVWLIQVDGTTVGYLVLTIGYSLEFHGRYALLDELFVEEQWRSQGIGAQALGFAEEQCRSRGLKALRLEVGRENLRALELYRRSGFELPDRYLMTKFV
ncbi:MAG: GNAT family N-acetyltransferase [Acidobacteriia bacterium]|nr:GNAT family N-acetyltransferase [Terriglobia bacterium]